MKEYIEKAAIIDLITRRYEQPELCTYEINSIPAADVAPVRHGRWMEYSGADKGFHYCSECKRQAFNYEENGNIIEALSKWCPNCGALMHGKEDEHETR